MFSSKPLCSVFCYSLDQEQGGSDIEGEKVRLEPLEKTHLPQSVEWLSDPEMMRLLGRRTPLTMAEEEKWFEEYLKAGKSKIFAIISKEGTHIGNLGLHNADQVNKRITLGIMIGTKSLWGKGYGSDAIMTALKHAFNDLGLHKVSLKVFCNNKRAVSSYEKCGFKKEGVEREQVFKDGRFHDLLVMSILDREFKDLMQERGTH